MQPAQQAAHKSWLRQAAAFLRRVDPLHLISAATEGFFVRNDTTNYHLYNPGALPCCFGLFTHAGAQA
jgi:hypothetical protein